MQIRIRLYSLHDFDLYSLYASVGKKVFFGLLKRSLNAYANGETLQIEPIKINEIFQANTKIVISMLVTINERKMPNAVEVLKHITEKRKNAFIKHIMRIYLSNILLQLYVDKETDICKVPVLPVQTVLEKKPIKEKIVKKEPIITYEEPVIIPEPITENNSDISELSNLFAGIQGMND